MEKTKVQEIKEKIAINFILDKNTLLCKKISAKERLIYLARKYYSIFSGKNKIYYLKNYFYYDTLFSPAILQIYPTEIEKLSHAIDIKELKKSVQDHTKKLSDLRFKFAANQLKNVKEIHTTKKEIARMMTIIKELDSKKYA